ncbi:NmrA family NAD(P)-binding protein [Nonomuraea turcica]|uniref:NmrA family NAD(P)-binding protein n=1 Tax=Nonomuraea sp. G32 TaxID=3067274 RepID=UPI00273BE2E2|nr:NmrA family NAD(P)-binding protein [Nonomuraea sp. G32]MDP4502530.1 NmrA family NAD(P)-binding protein [Nonomuraea sp. G32]
MAAQGAEVVEADVRDEARLTEAFDGAAHAYLVTNFWEHMSPEQEKQDAATMARAAKKAGLRHVIWSTLDDTRDHIPLDDERMPTLMGQYKVPHFDAKAEADRFFIDAGVPTTFLRTTFYRGAGQCSRLQTGGVGPRGMAPKGLSVPYPELWNRS